MLKRNVVFSVCLTLALLLSGCGFAAPQPTATPLPPAATFTPPPSPTATLAPTNTPLPTATSTPDAKATKAAIATAAADDAIKTIEGVFKKYNLSTAEGKFGEMIDEPMELSASTYGERNYDLLSDIPYKDFAFYTEITWKSTSGLAGCGLAFRTEDLKMRKDYYTFNTLRLSGAPAWDVEWSANGKFKTNAMGKIKFNNTINVENGDSNAYLLVVRGKNVTVYANGEKLGQTEINQRLDGGTFMALVFQESGETSCAFENSWVWNYE
jgi:hypothetical protein